MNGENLSWGKGEKRTIRGVLRKMTASCGCITDNSGGGYWMSKCQKYNSQHSRLYLCFSLFSCFFSEHFENCFRADMR